MTSQSAERSEIIQKSIEMYSENGACQRLLEINKLCLAIKYGKNGELQILGEDYSQLSLEN